MGVKKAQMGLTVLTDVQVSATLSAVKVGKARMVTEVEALLAVLWYPLATKAWVALDYLDH